MRNEARVGAFTVAGQPTADEVRALKGAGYSTVINVRMPQEPGQLDVPEFGAAGLDYVSIPYTGDTLTADHVRQVRAAVDAAGGSVLIH
jgi:uncharacterized protein (TIGR01244 family)